MPRGISNWTYKDVKEFLEYHDFTFNKTIIGSHEQWLSKDAKSIVDVNFIQGNESYPPKTLESMIRDTLPPGWSMSDEQEQRKHWRRWAQSGGHCC